MSSNTRFMTVLLLTAVVFGGAVSQDMVPPPRFGHTFTPIGSSLYLYGGYSSGDSATYLSDLSIYDPSENSWSTAHSFTEQPPGRSAHAAAVCRGWGMPDVYFGIVCGTGAEGELNDCWVYYPDEQIWVEKPQNGSDIPSPRTDHIAVCVDSELYIYGGRGCCGTGVRGDIWEERQEYEPRYGHSVATNGNNVYVYGGMGTELYDNIIIYDPEDDTWEAVEPQGQVPPARRLHAVACNGSKMWIIGGLGEQGELNDMWEYDFAGNAWVQKADAPVRPRAAAAINGDNLNQFFLFGGLDAALNPTNELWRYDAELDAWEVVDPLGASELPRAEMYELNARPNPFRTHTSFFIDPRFLSPDQAVRVHDIRGGLVTALTFEENGLGHGEVEWDGNDFFGRAVAPGTYLVKTPENEALTIIKLP